MLQQAFGPLVAMSIFVNGVVINDLRH